MKDLKNYWLRSTSVVLLRRNAKDILSSPVDSEVTDCGSNVLEIEPRTNSWWWDTTQQTKMMDSVARLVAMQKYSDLELEEYVLDFSGNIIFIRAYSGVSVLSVAMRYFRVQYNKVETVS